MVAVIPVPTEGKDTMTTSRSHPRGRNSERRRWRRRADQQQVIITDQEGELELPYTGWMLDRSPDGVCLWFEGQRIDEGTVLTVQSVEEEDRPIDEVRVVNVRRRHGKALLGCVYVRCDGG